MIDILQLLLETALAIVACYAFSALFHSPRRNMIFAGITGGAGWFVYSILIQLNMNTVISSFWATLFLTIVARYFSCIQKSPVTTFLITGIFPLVPGAGIYSAGYNLFMGNSDEALSVALNTAQIAVVIAMAMGLVLSLPQVLFSFKRGREGMRN